MYALTLKDLLERMEACEQTPGLSVLEHGQDVYQSFCELVSELEAGVGPTVLQNLWESLRERLVDPGTVWRYQVFHDCGKPECARDGHFPEHALHSANQWGVLYPEDRVVYDLMKYDMAFHTMNATEAAAFWKNPLAPTLYVTAWAEIRANAAMFGGEDSTSFKIKRKKLERAGRALKLETTEVL